MPDSHSASDEVESVTPPSKHHATKVKHVEPTEALDRTCRACGQVWTRVAQRYWRTLESKGVRVRRNDMDRWMCTRNVQTKLRDADTMREKSQREIEVHPDLQVFEGRSSNPTICREAREDDDGMFYVDETRIATQVLKNVVRQFYDALTSYYESHGSHVANGNTNHRPPGWSFKRRRGKKWGTARWNYTGIAKVDGRLRLSTARGEESIWIDWPHPTPRSVIITFDGSVGKYKVLAQYNSEQEEVDDAVIDTREPIGDEVVGVDLGEVYLAAATDGERTLLVGGQRLRDLRAVQNKEKAWFASEIDRKRKGSNRWWKLVHAKKKRLGDLNNRIRDVLHKHTTRLVNEVWAWGADTIVVGDLTGIRDRMNFGAEQNRRMHQWAFRQFTQMLEYKAGRYGMTVAYVGEAYTSQTCPNCGTAKRSHKDGRRFECSACSFEAHRDQVGARNIREKYRSMTSTDRGSAAWQSGYLEAVRATATASGEDAKGSVSGAGDSSPGKEKPQLNLFECAATPTRATPVLESPVRVPWTPHMKCVLEDP